MITLVTMTQECAVCRFLCRVRAPYDVHLNSTRDRLLDSQRYDVQAHENALNCVARSRAKEAMRFEAFDLASSARYDLIFSGKRMPAPAPLVIPGADPSAIASVHPESDREISTNQDSKLRPRRS